MKEVEVKILGVDRKQIEAKLVSLGAKKVFDGEIRGLFFDFPDKRIRKAKDTLRLRKVGEKSFITYKKYVGNRGAKVREEYEVEVSDFVSAKSILESIGLRIWMEMKKKRTSYVLRGVHFELDKHTDEHRNIPVFLEIEAKNIKALYKYVNLLGFKESDCRPWTIIEVAEYYRRAEK